MRASSGNKTATAMRYGVVVFMLAMRDDGEQVFGDLFDAVFASVGNVPLAKWPVQSVL